jgi:hypothetical protein
MDFCCLDVGLIDPFSRRTNPLILFAWANLFLAFILELAALYILVYWAFHLDLPDIWKWVLGLGAPLLFLVAWTIWAAPKSKRRLKKWKLWAYKAVAFGLAAWALWASGQAQWAVIFEGVVLVNLVLLRFWQRFEPS